MKETDDDRHLDRHHVRLHRRRRAGGVLVDTSSLHQSGPTPPQQFATITAAGDAASPAWFFVQVPEAKRSKNRVHVDLTAR